MKAWDKLLLHQCHSRVISTIMTSPNYFPITSTKNTTTPISSLHHQIHNHNHNYCQHHINDITLITLAHQSHYQSITRSSNSSATTTTILTNSIDSLKRYNSNFVNFQILIGSILRIGNFEQFKFSALSGGNLASVMVNYVVLFLFMNYFELTYQTINCINA